MRIAVISDIHSNLEALQAVLARIEDSKADEIVCLGDIVGYNANPNECIDILRQKKVTCIIGNHDACAAGLEEPDNFNPLARRAVLWTREQLTGENKAFLADLLREQRLDHMFFFHGSIHDTDRYILYKEDAEDNFRLLTGLPGSPRVGFFGHTHVRLALSYYMGAIAVELVPELHLASWKKYLINPGSVGQPRDGDPRAAFLLYDSAEDRIAFHHVEYDIRACQDKIIRAGLPPRLAERLASGW